MEHCNELECDRPVFTQKSGLCQRHYDRARTARLAADRPAVFLVRDTPCKECGAAGYRRVEDGVLCQSHWDRLRRRGTVEPAAKAPALSAAECSVARCAKLVHSKGLCQPHYRRAARNGSPTASGVIGRPRTGVTDHRALDPQVKARQLSERRAEHRVCAQGHELVGANRLTARGGAVLCRECRDASQRAYRRRTADERTHCRNGHELTESSVVLRKNDVRQCKTCVQNGSRYTRYGMTPAAHAALLKKQGGVCATCFRPERNDRQLAVDHDRSCCATDQSCGKCVRGLLCADCNIALGKVRDDVEVLRQLAKYVEFYT